MPVYQQALALAPTLSRHRRYLHRNPETHLDLPLTCAYVEEQLKALGYAPRRLGASGLVAMAGKGAEGPVFLLRGDMDALPIAEESGEAFASQNGNMHACGHDFHTAMLLGAAQLLKTHEDALPGRVALMFQPAEETLTGANMMLEQGLLELTGAQAGMMIHVATGLPGKTGSLFLSQDGFGGAAADWFRIAVQGRGCHGAMPHQGVDPLNILCHLHLALQALNSREIAPAEPFALTIGQLHGGNTSNVIPENAFLSGTIRTISDETRGLARTRLQEISTAICAAFGAQAQVEFERGCPCLVLDKGLTASVAGYCKALLGEDRVILLTGKEGPPSLGSEDFAYLSRHIPVTAVNLLAGSVEEGFPYPLHHPKARFREEALPVGAAVYAHTAMQWLADNA